MAEVLAVLGAVAAGTQLAHYGHKGVVAASALSRYVRHHSEEIRAWVRDLGVAIELMEAIKRSMSSALPAVTALIVACHEDVTKLASVLRPFTPELLDSGKSSTYEIAFVLREGSRIEALLTSFWTSCSRLATARTILSPENPLQPAALVVVSRRRRQQAIHDVLAVMSQLHHASVPIDLLSVAIEKDSLSEALGQLNEHGLVEFESANGDLRFREPDWQRFRSNLKGTADQERYLVLALRCLDARFPKEFAQPQFLRRSRRLGHHVESALLAALELGVKPSAFDEMAHLILRYCMYLITVGSYQSALAFTTGFLHWTQGSKSSQIDTATLLASKRTVAQALAGHLEEASSGGRTILCDRMKTFGLISIETAHSLNNVAVTCDDLGLNQEALAHHRKALAIKRKLLGKDDADILVSVNNWGIVLQKQGRYSSAERSFEKALIGWRKVYKPDDLFVLAARSNIGIAKGYQGRLDEAEALHRVVYIERHRILGPAHHETFKSRANLADIWNKKGDHVRAEGEYRSVLKGFQDHLDPSHPDTLKTHTNLARVLFDQSRYREADEVLAEALPLIEDKFGLDHEAALQAKGFRAILLQYQRDFTTAVDVASELYGLRLRKLGFEHDDTQRTLRHLRDLREDLEEAETSARFPVMSALVTV